MTAKPLPPPKETRPHVRDNEHNCAGKTPCGGACILNAAKRHQLHTCRDEHCPYCHSPRRFGRGLEVSAEPTPPVVVGWVKRGSRQ